MEDYYREHGVLMEFEINGGIQETLPRLMGVLAPYRRFLEQQQGGQADRRMTA